MPAAKIVGLHYSSTSSERENLTGGRVQLAITAAAGTMPLAKMGKLKVLAVAGTERSALVPELPTIAASGLPGYKWINPQVMFAPAKTPVAAIRKLNQEVVRFLQTNEAKERLLSIGTEAIGSSPDQLTVTMKSEIGRLSKLIKDVGIKVN